MAVNCRWILVFWTAFCAIARISAQYYPIIPWVTLPFRGLHQPLYMVHPLLYAATDSGVQVSAYGSYREDFFYQTTTAAAVKSADPATTATKIPILASQNFPMNQMNEIQLAGMARTVGNLAAGLGQGGQGRRRRGLEFLF